MKRVQLERGGWLLKEAEMWQQAYQETPEDETELRASLLQLINSTYMQYKEVAAFINSIEDELIKNIVYMHCMEFKTWKQIQTDLCFPGYNTLMCMYSRYLIKKGFERRTEK